MVALCVPMAVGAYVISKIVLPPGATGVFGMVVTVNKDASGPDRAT